jgi:predicted HAD superfamily Cof-like phosphohydrolase
MITTTVNNNMDTNPTNIMTNDTDMTFDDVSFVEDFLMGGDWVLDIYDMHTKFGVREVVEKIAAEDPAKLKTYLKFRLDMLQEELNEAQKAFAEADSDGIVDAIIDLSVFAIGTLDAFNVDAYEAWDRVYEANMAKEPGVKASRPNPFGFPDLIKPEGWTAPTHEDNVGLLPKAFE